MRLRICHYIILIWIVTTGSAHAQSKERAIDRIIETMGDTTLEAGINMINQFLANAEDCEPCKAKCYGWLGLLYCDHNQYSEGYYWINKAIELRRKQGDSLAVACNFLNISNAKDEEAKYSEAIENALLAMYILEEQHRLKNSGGIADTLIAQNLANVYNSLSNIHNNFENYDKSLQYAFKDLAIQRSIGVQPNLYNAYFTLGNCYFSCYQEDTTVTKYADSSASMYRVYLRYMNKNPDEVDTLYIANTHHNLASLAINRKDYRAAWQEMAIAEELYRIQEYYSGIIDVEILKANALIRERRDYRQALERMRTAQQLQSYAFLDDPVQLEVFNLLADCFEALGHTDSALVYSRRAERLNAQMFTSEQKRFNETDLAHLKKRNELERNISQLEISKGRARQRLWTLAATILALLAAIGALIWRQREQRQQQRIARQNRAIEDTLKDAQVRFLQGIIEGQQIERQETKHVLHNDIANTVLSLSYDIENTRPAHPQQQKWIADLRQLAAHTRRLSHQKGGIIHDIGLYDGINDLLRRIRQGNQIEVEFITNLHQKRLDTTTEVELWHIVQELVSNTLKYAHASRIELAIETDDTATYFTYNDNGDGFDYNQALKQEKSMGLHSIIEKTQALGGPMPQIISSPGHGLTVSIEIPHAQSTLS